MKFAALFVLIGVFFYGCKKGDSSPQLPAMTHTGRNVLGCMINGKVFVTGGKIDGALQTGVSASGPGGSPIIDKGRFDITAIGQSPRYDVFLSFKYDTLGGSFPIGQSYPMAGDYPYEASFFDYTNGTVSTGGNEYDTDSSHIGYVTITYYDGKIIAGTFQFDGVNDQGQVVHITDGRFDIAK